MGLSIVAGAISAAFFNIDKLQRFKGAGFEAEMRKAVEEAYATIENLREISKPLIISTLGILTFENRWGGMKPNQIHKLEQDLERISQSLSLEDVELDSAKETFYRYHTWDHYSVFINSLSKENDISKEVKERLGKLKDYNSSDFPSKEQLLDIIGVKMETLSLEIKEELQDYLYYKENHKLRRKESLLKF